MIFSLILRNGSALVVDSREVTHSDDEVFRGSVEQCCNEQDRMNRYRPVTTQGLKLGDIIQEGDLYFNNGKWIPAPRV